MRFAWQYETTRGPSFALPRVPLAACWARHFARGIAAPRNVPTSSWPTREHAPGSQRWGRDAEVIHPPVDVAEFDVPTRDDGYLLVAARLLAYRRVDIAVDAATSAGANWSSWVTGRSGALERCAGRRTFQGWRPRARADRAVRLQRIPRARRGGLRHRPGRGDGRRQARGGARPRRPAETVVDGVTGVLFENQTPAACRGLGASRQLGLDPVAIRTRAEQFDRARFFDEWRELFRQAGRGSQPLSGECQLTAVANGPIATRLLAHRPAVARPAHGEPAGLPTGQ